MDELFDVVGDDDGIVGRATRREAHALGLTHRSVLFFVFDRNGRVFVSQRTDDKEFYPGYWSIVLGGHVRAGESYEDAARRELEEEAGIRAGPVFMGAFKKRFDELDKENVRVYGFVAGQALTVDPGEIGQGLFVAPEELEEKVRSARFLPETGILLGILEECRRRGGAGARK